MNTPKGEETIFAEALRLPPEERAAYLAEATAGNAELRHEVESLLASYGAGDFLEQAAAPQSRQTINISVPVTEKPGDRIGRYKLLQQIGEGGCGVVYMAEQEEPVRRRVALKIIKLGMDTRSVIARFEAERQALALMDHPNIAKVLDAGATETGRPYFVMELVRGLKITEYCDEARLSTNARLDLFIQVCQAIQHAHQKGIIHRDIKPSNILVSANDGVLVPKVIDFGIAKATSGQQLTDKTLFTAFEQFIGTPAYMSPEQAMITNVDIDTRSDIYALGVLLYELLTGKTPFDAKELLAIGLDEMRRTIREQEPPRPSTRLSTLPGQELSTTAQRRGLDAPKLVSELRGDLDWIVMKALEKDRSRRYETANGLAADVQRHINNEPVVACPPSRVYQLRKTVRRNKLAFSAAASVVAALAIGLAISTWRFVKEREALKRAVAAEQAAKEDNETAEDVLKFVRDKILAAGRPEGMGGGVGKNVTLRQAIDRAESKIAKTFTNRPLVEAAIRKTMGESYLYLGEPALAIPQLERALALRREGLGIENEHTVGTMTKLRHAYQDAGKPFEFLPFYEEAFKLSKARLGAEHANTLTVMVRLAEACEDAGKRDQAVALLEEAFERSKAKFGPLDFITLERMDTLARVYVRAGKHDQAVSLFEENLKLVKSQRGPEHSETLTAMNNLAVRYSAAGKSGQALALYEEALKGKKAKDGPEHHDTLVIMRNLAEEYAKAKKFDQALALYEETLKLRKATLGPEHDLTLDVMNNLASAYKDAGKLDQAIPLYEETLKLRKATLGPEHYDTLVVMNDLGVAYAQRQPEQAQALLAETLKLKKTTLGPEHRETLTSMNNLAWAYRNAGKFDRALPLYEETLKLRKANLGPEHADTLDVMIELAKTYKEAQKLDQALPLYEETLKLRKATLGPEDSATLLTMNELGIAYYQAGKSKQAEVVLEEALKLKRAKHGSEHRETLTVMNNLANAYRDLRKFDQAIALHEETLKLSRARLGPDHSDTVRNMANLANAYQSAGKLDQAIPLWEEALKLLKATLGPEHRDTLIGMLHLADAYKKAGKLDQAFPLFEEALKLQKATLGPEHRETLTSMNNLGLAYGDSGQSGKAIPLLEETVKLSKATKGPEDPGTLMAMHNLGLVLRDTRQLDRALPLLEETLKLRKAKLGPQDRGTLLTMRTLAVGYRDSGQLDQALPLFQELLKLNTAVRGPDHPETRLTMEGLAKTLRKGGNLVQAEAMFRALAQQTGAVPTAKFELGRLLLENAETHSAGSRRREELASEGERLVSEYLAGARSRYTNDPMKLAEELKDVAELRYRQGNYSEAAPLYRELVQSRRARLSAEHKDVLEPTASLARVLSDWAWAERTNTVAAEVTRLTSPSSEPSTPRKTDQSLVTSAATTPHERAREAERLLRDVLAVWLRDSTNSWRIGDVKSRLGAALVSVAITAPATDADGRVAKLAEAESLLLDGHERLQKESRERKYQRDAVERIVRLYEAWNKPDKRAEWQQKLELFDKAQKKSSASDSLTEGTSETKAETK